MGKSAKFVIITALVLFTVAIICIIIPGGVDIFQLFLYCIIAALIIALIIKLLL